MINVERIYIKNFKRYGEVDIRPEKKPGIFIFVGKNYLGKSNFLNAICWCLYEETPFTQNIEEKDLQNDNILNIDTEKKDEFAEVRVEIEISYEKHRYKFSRSYRKTQNSKFNVFKLDGQDWKIMPNPNIILEMLLPKNLRQYFIFAGENLERLYSQGFQKELKSGVWSVSNIAVLDRAIEHLNNISTELRREGSKVDVNIIPLEKAREACENNLDKNKKDIIQIEEQISQLRKIQRDYREEQKKYEESKTILERMAILEQELEEADDIKDKIKEKINNFLTEKTPFLYLREVLMNVSKNLSEQEKAGKLPPDVQAGFLKKLLEDNVCICKREINDKDGSKKALRELILQFEKVSQLSFLLGDRYIINKLLDEQKNLKEELDTLINDRARIEAKRDSFDREKKDIQEKLKGSEVTSVSNIEIAVEDVESKIQDYLEKKAQLNYQISDDERRKKDLEAEIDKTMQAEVKNKKIVERLQFSKNAYGIIDTIRNRITDRIRRTLSSNTEKYFKELFWDKDQFEKIEFTEDYDINIFEKGIDRPKKELAMGEGKVLGLATMRAIAEISGFSEVPVFFDAPLSNLGAEIKANLLKVLHEFAPNKQIFIFSLDDIEMLDFIKTQPKNRIFKLQKDTKNQHSTIITPYYD